MKIVCLTDFLRLPCNTVFSKYEPCIFGPLAVKKDSIGDYDFFYVEIANCIDATSSDHLFDLLDDAKTKGGTISLDFECWSRDGMFDTEQFFAVWERQDLEVLISSLISCLDVFEPRRCT